VAAAKGRGKGEWGTLVRRGKNLLEAYFTKSTSSWSLESVSEGRKRVRAALGEKRKRQEEVRTSSWKRCGRCEGCSGVPKEPYITHKRALHYKETYSSVCRSDVPKEPYMAHKRAPNYPEKEKC